MTQGVRLYRQRKFQEALEALLETEVEQQDYAELSYYLGLCYTQLGQYDEALLYLEQVVSSDLSFPHLYQSRMILGYIYAITGRSRLAEFEFARLLEDGYESPAVYAALAYANHDQGKVAPAIANLEKALELDPDNANAKNSLGYILADQGIKVDRALKFCVAAVERSPENAAYLDSLGWAQYQSGRVREAADTLRRAQMLAPTNRVIAEHLNEVRQSYARR